MEQTLKCNDVLAPATTIYISPAGRDEWSGRLAEPNADRTDGPLASLAAARDAIRQCLAADPRRDGTVLLRGGRYELTEPVVFTADDSAPEGHVIRYAAYPGERPLISGGRVISGWRKTGANLWTVHLPEVQAGRWWFRQLFADDRQLKRARWPKGDAHLVLESVNTDDGSGRYTLDQAPECGDLSSLDAELVIVHLWSASRGIVASLEGKEVRIAYPLGWQGHEAVSPDEGRKAWLEHAPQFLTEPGEFYLDRKTGTLSLIIAPGEDPNDWGIVAPLTERILIVCGEKDRPVARIEFEGIRFEHTNWSLPQRGFSEIQSGHYGTVYNEEPTYALPLAIELTYAGHIRFESCRLAHFGACGIGLGAGACDNRILGCTFDDIGGNGVMIGYRPVANGPTNWFNVDWDDPTDAPFNNEILHGRFRRCAAIQYSCVAIWVAYSARTRIAQNLIEDLPYIAISAGFIWNAEPTTMRECIIEFNEIRDIMKMMFDGGGVYTLGDQPGTVVRNNFIHDVVYGHGLYTDEGSRNILFEKNVIFRVGDTAYQHHHGHENTLRNNIFACARALYVRRYREDEKISFHLDRNIFWVDGGRLLDGTWNNGLFKFTNNIYWCTKASPLQFLNITHGWISNWRKMGHDVEGKFIDPCFVDPLHGDFRLRPESPLPALGFEPIDLSAVGPAEEYSDIL